MGAIRRTEWVNVAAGWGSTWGNKDRMGYVAAGWGSTWGNKKDRMY